MTVERLKDYLIRVKKAYWMIVVALAILLVLFVWLGNSSHIIIAIVGGVVVGNLMGFKALATTMLKRIEREETN